MIALLPLPLLAGALLWGWAAARLRSWRDGFVLASVSWGVFLVVSSEALGAFEALAPVPVALAWAAAAVGAALLFARRDRGGGALLRERLRSGWSEHRYSAWALGFLFAVIAVGTLCAPPNNWDTHSYHLPRVLQWISHGSLRHYPTAIEKQLMFAPWAEEVIAHLYLLSGGGDRFAFFPQWFSGLGSVLVVSLLARDLGLTMSGQIRAALLAATLPMLVLQAGSTQNDLVVAYWTLVTVYLVLRHDHPRRLPSPIPPAALTGAALGLAFLSKGTALFYLAPWGAWFLWRATRGPRPWRAVALFATVAIALNLPHASRNVATYGKPLGAVEKYPIRNERVTPAVLLSNLLRNFVLHIPVPGRYGPQVHGAVAALHRPLGLDVNARETTYEGRMVMGAFLPRSEHAANAPLHLALLILAAPAVLRRRRDVASVLPLVACLATSTLLFCALLKWQTYHVRLHLPLLLLAMPLVALGLACRPPRFAFAAGVAVASLALVPLFFGEQRPWFGPHSVFTTDRTEQYFVERPEQYPSYRKLEQWMAGQPCRRIGLLLLGEESWEYPVWVAARATGAELRHVDVKNRSAATGEGDWEPCALVTDFSDTRPGYSTILRVPFSVQLRAPAGR